MVQCGEDTTPFVTEILNAQLSEAGKETSESEETHRQISPGARQVQAHVTKSMHINIYTRNLDEYVPSS